MGAKKTAIYSAILFLVIVICAIGIFPVRAFGQEGQIASVPTVLVLHSYHRQLSWVKSIEEGILSHFEKANPSVELRFEYMDTKRITDPDYIRMLYDLYQYKFKDARFNVIICSDNNALNFLLKHHDNLFPGTPVVFCGINNFNDAMIAGKNMFTGTVEGVSFKETLDVAIDLHPGTRQIAFYGDNSPTYFANKALMEQIAAEDEYKHNLEFFFKDNVNIKQIQDLIRRLDKNSLILIGSTMRDEAGTLLSFEQSIIMMEKVSRVPIYGCWDFHLDHGIVGGKLISGFPQGETAAKIANRIIEGENADTIPVIKTSPNRYMFDYHQLKKFNIKTADLPVDSIVINEPYSLYSLHKNLFWGTIAAFLSLVMIIFLLMFNINHRKRAAIILKKAEKATRESEKKYRELADSLPQVVFETNETGKIIYVNQNAFDLFGYSKDELDKGLNVMQMISSKDRDRPIKNMQNVLNGTISGAGSDGVEYSALRGDGTTFPAVLHSNLVTHNAKPIGLRG